MSEYMYQCGALWSPVIVAMYCYSFYLSFAIIYQFIAIPLPTLLTADFIAGIATELFILVLFLVFPLVSVASANAAIAPVVHMFTNSGSCDFAMMGMYVCMYVCRYCVGSLHSSSTTECFACGLAHTLPHILTYTNNVRLGCTLH